MGQLIMSSIPVCAHLALGTVGAVRVLFKSAVNEAYDAKLLSGNSKGDFTFTLLIIVICLLLWRAKSPCVLAYDLAPKTNSRLPLCAIGQCP